MAEKTHLMPWRVLVEVGKYASAQGHKARIVSLGSDYSEEGYPDNILPTSRIRKDKKHLVHDLSKLKEVFKPQLVFWPFSWRDPAYRIRGVSSLGAKVVAYFPGGHYTVPDSFFAVRKLGLMPALPYLAEALSPHSRTLSLLNKCNIKTIITLSELSRRIIIADGWREDRVRAILPGKESEFPRETIAGLPDKFASWLNGNDYFLFMGPPTPIRGVLQLLQAFARTAEKNPAIRLVCLLRSDPDTDPGIVVDYIHQLPCKERIFTVWESVSRESLSVYLANCRAVCLPFILVPSEIPLAAIEAASYGKPVIGTKCGGTGDFITSYGDTARVGDIDTLAHLLVKYHSDNEYYAGKCSDSRAVYLKHLTWPQMAREWINVATD